jgi:hypothetical protein
MTELYRAERFLLPCSDMSEKKRGEADGPLRFALVAGSPDPDPVVDLGLRRLELVWDGA